MALSPTDASYTCCFRGLGDLYTYHSESNLACFCSGQLDLRRSKCLVVFVGGLTDRLHSKRYLVPLSQRLESRGGTLVQPILSSAGLGYGTSSLLQDAIEIGWLLRFLHNESCANGPACLLTAGGHQEAAEATGCTMPPVCFIGHSTGCQDALFLADYLHSCEKQSLEHFIGVHKLKGLVLQGPVSDRELAEKCYDPTEGAMLEALSILSNVVPDDDGRKVGCEFVLSTNSLEAIFRFRQSATEKRELVKEICTWLSSHEKLELFRALAKWLICSSPHTLDKQVDVRGFVGLYPIADKSSESLIAPQLQRVAMPAGSDMGYVTAARFLGLNEPRESDDYFSSDLFFDETRSEVNAKYIAGRYAAVRQGLINVLVVASLADEFAKPLYKTYMDTAAAITRACVCQEDEEKTLSSQALNIEVTNVIKLYEHISDRQVVLGYGIEHADHALSNQSWQDQFIHLCWCFFKQIHLFE